MKIHGDPQKLADHVLHKVIEETRPQVEKAYQDALKLLEQAYQAALQDAKEKLLNEYNKVVDEVKSLEASLEKDMKLEASKKRSLAVEEVLEEARKRLASLPDDRKQKIYASLARDFAHKAHGGESYRVLVRKGETQLVKKAFQEKSVASLLKEKSIKISITEGLESQLGGFKAEGGDGKIVFDYTLELVFESLRPLLSGTASRVLFEE